MVSPYNAQLRAQHCFTKKHQERTETYQSVLDRKQCAVSLRPLSTRVWCRRYEVGGLLRVNDGVFVLVSEIEYEKTRGMFTRKGQVRKK